MKIKFLRSAVTVAVAVLLAGGAFALSACNDGDGATGYSRTVLNLAEMEDYPFTAERVDGEESALVLPYDSWGTSKFLNVKHTFTLYLGDVGLADSDALIKTAIASDGTVGFASGDSKTALESVNLITDAAKTIIEGCNFAFKLQTYLKGNGLSDGFTGEGYSTYIWYGTIEDAQTDADGSYYVLPECKFVEYYIDGTLSHGGSTTSIVPDAGFYINTLIDQNAAGWEWSAHRGSTDRTLVNIGPDMLKLPYFNATKVYVDGSKITKFVA